MAIDCGDDDEEEGLGYSNVCRKVSIKLEVITSFGE